MFKREDMDAYREVAAEYASELMDLTFNSKPIINNLTIIAGENLPASTEIVSIIEGRVLKAHMEKKLPILYLLDSIIKNIGGIYLKMFTQNIVHVFCTAFETADVSTRIAMQHLLKTWYGVFPPEKIEEMQERIKSFSVPPIPSPHVPVPYGGVPPQRNAVPHGIHVNPRYLSRARDVYGPPSEGWNARGEYDQGLLRRPGGPVGMGGRPGMRDERIHPYRRHPQSQPRPPIGDYNDNIQPLPTSPQRSSQEQLIQQTNTVISQIQQQIQAGNRQQNQQQLLDLLQMFLKQQKNPQLKDDTSSDLLPLLLQYQQQQLQLQQMQSQKPTNTNPSLFYPQSQRMAVNTPTYNNIGFPNHNSTMMVPPNVMNSQNTASLLETLSAMGFLNSNSHNSGMSNINKPIVPNSAPAPSSVVSRPAGGIVVPGSATSGASSTSRSLLPTPAAPLIPKGPNVLGFISASTPSTSPPSTSAIDLKRPDRNVINTLYTDFTLQCKACGLRFNNSELMGKHLDWHFAANRNEKMRSKQAISRPWYLSAEDWALFHGAEILAQRAASFFEDKAPAEEPEEEAQWSCVVADESATHCAVCHEAFDQFWDTEQEEWMYRAAVINPADGLITHQKCLYSLVNGTAAHQHKSANVRPFSSAQK